MNANQEHQFNKENINEESKNSGTLILGILLVYGLFWHLQVIFGWFGIQFGPEGPPSVLIWNWIAVAGAAVFIIFIEKRSWNSIGLNRPTIKDIIWAFAFWIIGFLATNFVHSLIPPPESSGLNVMLSLSIPVLLGIIITTSVTEEVIYRGYLIERLEGLTGNIWISATISLILFVIPHVTFFGPMWLIYHSYTTFLIYGIYLWRRNLWSCIILHLLSNMLILLPALGVV